MFHVRAQLKTGVKMVFHSPNKFLNESQILVCAKSEKDAGKDNF